jgi:hypothetical protein
MISLKGSVPSRSDQPTAARGSIRSREGRGIARSQPEPRYEVFRRTKGDLVRVCVVEGGKAFAGVHQNRTVALGAHSFARGPGAS